jgi:alkanesulfonate monooxygenase SsuD/methylene tetrahydromethanopterin reductase-like flavin-dependent oxidoreductase (luciferase family)
VAEDAAVLDHLCGGRFELGVGTGGNPSAFAAFGLDSARRNEIFARNLDVVRNALAGKPLDGGDTLYPQRPQLCDRIWQATFSVTGGARAGKAGDGLLLSRTQPRTKEAPRAALAEIQNPIIDAYLEALPPGRSHGSWRRAVSSSPTTIARRCVLPISGCGVRSRNSSRAVTPSLAGRWRR